jgi:hypothetical protein
MQSELGERVSPQSTWHAWSTLEILQGLWLKWLWMGVERQIQYLGRLQQPMHPRKHHAFYANTSMTVENGQKTPFWVYK